MQISFIFVKDQEIEKSNMDLINKMSTFVVDSLPAAFDLSYKLINLLDPLKPVVSGSDKMKKSSAHAPQIPANTVEPFDIIEKVILKISDKGSFTEFYQNMNDKIIGPNLITGVAEFAGRPTGVIADQPTILGGAARSYWHRKIPKFCRVSR